MKKYCQNIIPALFIIILLLIWEAAVGFFHIPLYVLPSPVQVIRTLFSELRRPIRQNRTHVHKSDDEHDYRRAFAGCGRR